MLESQIIGRISLLGFPQKWCQDTLYIPAPPPVFCQVPATYIIQTKNKGLEFTYGPDSC